MLNLTIILYWLQLPVLHYLYPKVSFQLRLIHSKNVQIHDSDNVSTFNTVEVAEYISGICVLLYGFSSYTFTGELYGPSLWFNCANLKIIHEVS